MTAPSSPSRTPSPENTISPIPVPAYFISTTFHAGSLTKSSKIKFEDSALTIKTNNHIGSSELPSKAKAYKPMFDFICSSPVYPCMMCDPEVIYLHLLREFWWTCDYVESTKSIIGTVLLGTRNVTITVDNLRRILLLPSIQEGEVFESPATAEEWKAWLPSIGYCHNNPEAAALPIPSSPLKMHLPGVWRLLFTHVIQCLGGNSGSYNQASTISMPIIHALATGRRVDYANLVFEDMVQKVSAKNRSHTVPFTRFFSLIFKDLLGDEYDQEGAHCFAPARIGVNVYNAPAEEMVAPMTSYMKEVLFSFDPQSYPKDSTEVAAPQTNEAAVPGAVDASLPIETGSLDIPPAASKVSKKPVKRPSQAKSSTLTTSSSAAVPKRKRSEPQGKTTKSSRMSSLPKDTLDQPIPPAVSKKAAGKLKGHSKQPPQTSVGGVGEEKGLSQPIRGHSPIPIITPPSSKPPESQSELAESQPALETAKSAANETLATQHAEEEAQINQSPVRITSDLGVQVEGSESVIDELTGLFDIDDTEELVVEEGASDLFIQNAEEGWVLKKDEMYPYWIDSELASQAESPSIPPPPKFSPTPPSSPIPPTFINSPLPFFAPSPTATTSPPIHKIDDVDEEVLMEIPPHTHPDFWNHPVSTSYPTNSPTNLQKRPTPPSTNDSQSDHVTHHLQLLQDEVNRQCHLFASLVDHVGSLQKDWYKSALIQCDRTTELGAELQAVQEMIKGLSKNQVALHRLGENVLARKLEVVMQQLKRLNVSHSQLYSQIERIAASVSTSNDFLNDISDLVSTVAALERSNILLTAGMNHLCQAVSSLSTQQSTTLSTITSLINTISTHDPFLLAADRALLRDSISRQTKLETEMGEMKGMLHQILGLLAKPNVEAAVSPAASKGEKVAEEVPSTEAHDEQVAEPVSAAALGKHVNESVGASAQGEQVPEQVSADAQGEQVDKTKRAFKGKAIMTEEPAPKKKKIAPSEKLLGASIAAASRTAAGPSVFETLYAAASGLSVEDLKRKQQEEEEEVSLRLARELLSEEVKTADAEVQLLASQKKDILEVSKQRQLDFEARKAEEAASERKLKEEFLSKIKQRKKPEKITYIKPSMVKNGKETNVVLAREGSLNTHFIENIKAASLGASEWVEVHKLIKGRVGANYSGLHRICSEFFDRIRIFEKRFDIKNSILLEAGESSTPPPKKPVKKFMNTGTFSFSTPALPLIEGDALLNTMLPSSSLFEEGLVLKNPAGIFYSNIHGSKKFFRLSEISIASTKFLLAIRKHCILTSNDNEFIKVIDQELTKAERVTDPAYVEAKLEQEWDQYS